MRDTGNTAKALGLIVREIAGGIEGREDRPADQLGDLGDYGVAEGGKSVQSSGYPITASSQTGLSSPPVVSHSDRNSSHQAIEVPIFERRSPRAFLATLDACAEAGSLQLDLSGVGNNPDTIPSMRGANGGSRNAMPLCIIPERGQVSENSAKPPASFPSKQSCDVLHEDESGSKLASQSDDLAPQSATFGRYSGHFARERKVLAGEPSSNDVDLGNPIGSKSFTGEFAYVDVAGDIGPVLGEDAAGELFDFAERDRLETACAFEAKGKSSYAGKQIEDAQLLHAADQGSKPKSFAGKLAFSSARTDGS